MTTEQFIQEQQDRCEIRGLVDAYACCADRRICEGQMSLLTSAMRHPKSILGQIVVKKWQN